MGKLPLQIFIYLILFPAICTAQVTVTYPANRIVFQRDNSNQASVVIAGYFAGCADRIEARFVPRETGQGTAAPAGGGWATVQENPRSGNFYGSVSVTGGWYKLEVRIIVDNAVTVTTTVERVGIGEVFVVAGQSNATGGDNNANGPGATDDRVNSVNFQNYNAQNSPSIAPYSAIHLPCPEFVHLDDITKTSPFGNYAWCWGAFGDSLVKKLQVPVMIFNAGWSSTGVRNWKESIPVNGTTTSDFGFQFPAGLPFGHIRITLNNYIAQLGVRAILWHQGETDNMVSRTREDYLSDIREVIKATRDLSGKDNLAWVVSRASRFNVDGATRTWQPVIDAQNDVIGLGSHGNDLNYKMANVFPGPETDAFYDINYRNSDQVHFTGNGLLHLAGWWREKLNDDFFKNSTPYPATPPPNVSVLRTETANVVFQAPDGLKTYDWISGNNCNTSVANSRQWTIGDGDYQLKATDAFNNVILSAKIRVPLSSTPASIAGNLDVSQQMITNSVNNLLVNDCKIIAKITPAENSSIINQTLTAKAYIDGSVQSYQNSPYVQRHFDIKLSTTNSNPLARITLFFTQNDFDAFNSVSSVDIPSTPSDQSGKNNLRVIQFSGTSSGNTAAQNSYNGNRTQITPASVNWNSTLNSWEVSFDMTSTGGFFLGTTSTPLPVTLTYFKGNPNGSTAVLDWETSAETNSAYFEVERSTDAIHFQTIAKQFAAGNSATTEHYNHQDNSLPSGIYYYRLKQVDLDDSYHYSRVISVKISTESSVRIFPNPVSDQLSIQSEIEINSVEIINSFGIKLQSNMVNKNSLQLDMSKFPSGLYIIRVNNEGLKIVKK
ncbi:T9SS type A sorting domain-containing protein [Dyadobacter subterraneus]|uniref:T9SS type A sorting domain-containing protein n=1 Tax=Dyadobacter subterraneus TaxID=2773304 RepID=A0ABR9WHU0_9BACT|nr:T9SS type A sorting domain-containing protein [Dyadobacter subterraneus]MBE9465088.1 T9SS type A sorting domain-containing protein [Dyadobacter subterraneus]